MLLVALAGAMPGCVLGPESIASESAGVGSQAKDSADFSRFQPAECGFLMVTVLRESTSASIAAFLCPVYMLGYWQGCRQVIISFGLILMFMSTADALRRQCSISIIIHLKWYS